MARASPDESQAFLSTLPPGRSERQLAVAVVLLSLVVFLAMVPFAKVPLAQVWAFIPIYESALVINDLITAVLLFGQFGILRSRALLVLASGYLFTALMAALHALTFPGLFTPTGLLGAGSQSTAWLYMFWHGGFPLFVIAYALLKEGGREADMLRGHAPVAALSGAAAAIALACGFAFLATAGQDALPLILQNRHYTPAYITVVSSVLVLNLLALVALWQRRPHSVLDIWLVAVMCAWLFDIALSAILNEARFDLGFYAGRIYGLLAASFVLMVLLLENGMLHARLAKAHERERQKATDLQQIGAQLVVAKNEMEDLYNNAPCGYHSVDENGWFVRINDTLLDWLGHSREEVIGKLRHPDVMTTASARIFEEKFALFKQQGWLKDVEFEYARKNGTVFSVSLNATTIRDATGCYVMSRSTVFDITERRRIEAALRERDREITLKNQQLEEADRMKSEFLANMSHELRTPLNAIIGFAEVLRDGMAGNVSAEQREYLDDIHSGGLHLLSLINDILDLSKVEAGRMTLDLENVTVETVLTGALSILRERAGSQHITLHLETAPDTGEICVDVRRLKQIVYNLLSNAVKFTPHGGTVTLSARRTAAADLSVPANRPEGIMDFLEIAVTDTGIGIPPEHLSRLFSAFTQLDNSLSRQYEGTGLGLALVKKLAELHGGAVSVQSEPGRGSIFTVWLPYRPSHNRSATRRPAAEPLSKPGGHVLVVEDDKPAGNLIQLWLEREGFAVDRKASAEEARAWLAAHLPDLITLDVLLPGEDGWSFLAWLKSDATRAHIPVVVVSIVAEENKGFALGASAVLQKPIGRDDLVLALRGLGMSSADRRPVRVMVIDDDSLSVELQAKLLESEGHAVHRCHGGREGVAAALSNPPDLILLDLLMPDLSGFEVAQVLKADKRTARVPIIIVTAKTLTEGDRRELNGHIATIVAKSDFAPEALLAEVHRALAVRAGPQRAPRVGGKGRGA